MVDIVKHRNKWPFGDSTVIVIDGGYGIVKVTHETDWPDECTIIGISVHESKRRQGLGNKLLEEAEKEAKEYYKTNRTCLYTDSNEFTTDWYRRHGYKEDEDKIEIILEYPNMIKLYKEL